MEQIKCRSVDPLAACTKDARIYEDENGIIWNCMLNFTNISYGTFGNNKFYMIQLIEENGKYFVFRKWGRVGGKTPQKSFERHGKELNKAKASFQTKFSDKTHNDWPLTQDFERIAGKYVLLELEDDTVIKTVDNNNEEITSCIDIKPTTLPEEVQNVLQLIGNLELIAKEIAALHIDLKRQPLGRLSKNQIGEGYILLEKLSSVITLIDVEKNEVKEEKKNSKTRSLRRSSRTTSKTISKSSISSLRSKLKDLTSEFYTLIPHDFGRQCPPIIDSMQEIKRKLDLLEVLADVEITQQIRAAVKEKSEAGIHPFDAQYELLDVEMQPLAVDDKDFQVINEYVKTTHAPTHNQYKLEIQSVIKIHRKTEASHESDNNSRMLLWHGSRLCNALSILVKGLRIAPPEAPSNGYMFGKGIYFADSVSKSANYCWATPEKPQGLLFLADVDLGKQLELLGAEDVNSERLGIDSVVGVGRMASNKSDYLKTADGVAVPAGKLLPNPRANMLAEELDASPELLYNEYVVYRTDQVKLRYLVVLNFVF